MAQRRSLVATFIAVALLFSGGIAAPLWAQEGPPDSGAASVAVPSAQRPADVELRRAQELAAAGRVEEAVQAYWQTIRLDKTNIRAYEQLAQMLHLNGRRIGAATVYWQAIPVFQSVSKSGGPDAAEARRRLAYAWAYVARQDESIAVYRTIVYLEPQRASLWTEFGEVLVSAERAEDAAAAFERAEALAEPMPEPDWLLLRIHYGLGKAYDALERKREAQAEYRRAWQMVHRLRRKGGDVDRREAFLLQGLSQRLPEWRFRLQAVFRLRSLSEVREQLNAGLRGLRTETTDEGR